MSTVKKFYGPQAISNVPHMLRVLAKAIEDGDHGEITGLLVVIGNNEEGSWPPVMGFGPDEFNADTNVIGLLELAKAFIVNNHVVRR